MPTHPNPVGQGALDRLCRRIAQAQDDIPEPGVPEGEAARPHEAELAHLDGLLLALATLLDWPEQSAPDARALRYMQLWRQRHASVTGTGAQGDPWVVSSEFQESDPARRGPA